MPNRCGSEEEHRSSSHSAILILYSDDNTKTSISMLGPVLSFGLAYITALGYSKKCPLRKRGKGKGGGCQGLMQRRGEVQGLIQKVCVCGVDRLIQTGGVQRVLSNPKERGSMGQN